MKSIYILLSIFFLHSCGKRHSDVKRDDSSIKQIPETQGESDSTVSAKNKKIEARVSLTENESDFLIEASDGRLMGMLEGKAAVAKGTTQEIKDYGQLMIKDQTTMLNELKSVATRLSIPLLDTISEEKQGGLQDLLEKESKKFDKKFIKMMKIDHRRDVSLFKNAQGYDNPTIKAFAMRFLPMIESHLEKAKNLRKKKTVTTQPVVKK